MSALDVTVDGVRITAALHAAAQPLAGAPLLVALHGGTYSGEYYRIAGSAAGSYVDVANRNGFSMLVLDRPGYGGSDLLPEDENTFARQAELLDAAVGEMLQSIDASSVVLVGHSIGGMITLELAARHPSWPLVGVAVTGMGARIPAGGAAETLGSLPFEGVIDLPVPDREGVMFGPAGTFSEDAAVRARASYAPTPFVELVRAPQWARERLSVVAPEVAVPVHHGLAEFDALWDTSPEARDAFLAAFAAGVPVESSIVAGVGHSIDHHLLGVVVQLRQLAFALEVAGPN
jgi:pimeloyl-ACP methyl ester carboxylesterase